MLTQPKLYNQLGGEAGIMQTVGIMKRIVNQSILHPYIRERAISLTSYCRRNFDCEDRTLLGWVNGSVNFIRDPYGVESLHDPVSYVEDSLRRGIKPAGDCDDMSMYLAALLKSIGHQPRFLVIGRNSSQLHHVLIWCHGRLDPTMQTPIIDKPFREVYIKI